MRQRHSCISHGSILEHNVLRSWHATVYKFVTSMMLCGQGMQQCAMHNAAIQKTTLFELGGIRFRVSTCSENTRERVRNWVNKTPS